MTLIQIIIMSVLVAAVIFLVYIIYHSVISPQKADGIKSLLKQGKTSNAIRLAKNLISKNPNNFHAHYYLGKAYVADNRPELALMEFKIVNQRAIFDQDLPEKNFREELASLYSRFNQTEEALKEYILLSKLDPSNAETFFNTGLLFEKKNKTDQALSNYQKAININKRHAKAHAAKGRLLYKAKQYNDSKKELDVAISLSPDLFENFYYLGKILKENKDYAGAVNAFEKSLRDQKFKQRSYIERGSCYMAVSQENKAVIEFEKAVSASKNEASQETLYARYFLATCYEQQRKIDLALAQWEKIYVKSHSFRDVAAKLASYRDLQANDNMKEYLTCNTQTFLEMCKNVATEGLKLAVKQVQPTQHGCRMIASEKSDDNWMNMRQQLKLILFYREPELIEDVLLRKILEEAKKNNCVSSIVCTSSGFTRTAKTFAESRPIKLVDRKMLESKLSVIPEQ